MYMWVQMLQKRRDELEDIYDHEQALEIEDESVEEDHGHPAEAADHAVEPSDSAYEAPVYIADDIHIPPEFELRESKAAGVGLGVWTKVAVQAGEKMGPFTGLQKTEVKDMTYAWELSLLNKDHFRDQLQVKRDNTAHWGSPKCTDGSALERLTKSCGAKFMRKEPRSKRRQGGDEPSGLLRQKHPDKRVLAGCQGKSVDVQGTAPTPHVCVG
ncbi:hypothetical protein Bbelb_059380 [Branchiostoma belcheri]|nr:hypothetical protein Bbelb_059380 [Branchiostoma belcheri]